MGRYPSGGLKGTPGVPNAAQHISETGMESIVNECPRGE
jgi:hypothetical protein